MGVEDEEQERAALNNYAGGMRARIIEGPGLYYMGIIDTLQVYNWKKRLETLFKTYVLRSDGDGISCVDPLKYQERSVVCQVEGAGVNFKIAALIGQPVAPDPAQNDFVDF